MTDSELLEAAANAAGMPNTGEVYALGLKLLEGPHNFGVFVCGPEGYPDDSMFNEELTAALDAMLGAA